MAEPAYHQLRAPVTFEYSVGSKESKGTSRGLAAAAAPVLSCAAALALL